MKKPIFIKKAHRKYGKYWKISDSEVNTEISDRNFFSKFEEKRTNFYKSNYKNVLT